MQSSTIYAITARMYRRLGAICVFSILLPVFLSAYVQASIPSAASDWQRDGERRGVELYRREVPGSSVIQLKGTGSIAAPLWKVAAILLDTERAPEWVDSLAESKVWKRLEAHTYIEYNHIRTPFILKDRDFVSLVHIDVDPRRKTFALRYEPSEETVPDTHRIRGKILSAVFELSRGLEPNTTILNAQIHCDPMGTIPKWLVNFFQSDWAFDTFSALRVQATKPDITVPARFSAVLAPTLSF